jgi:hypothetical protein
MAQVTHQLHSQLTTDILIPESDFGESQQSCAHLNRKIKLFLEQSRQGKAQGLKFYYDPKKIQKRYLT